MKRLSISFWASFFFLLHFHCFAADEGTIVLTPPQNPTTVKIAPTKSRPKCKSIPLTQIETLLSKNQVFSVGALNQKPYVVYMVGEHETGGFGGMESEFYVRAILSDKNKYYHIFRPGQVFVDPTTKAVLGQEATYVGEAKLLRAGDPAVFTINNADFEILQGDRLISAETLHFPRYFYPQLPKLPIHSQILSILGEGLTQIGVNDSVVIGAGRANGIQVGDILSVKNQPHTVLDPLQKQKPQLITLPGPHAGKLLVYKVFDHVSFALVTEAVLPIRQGDFVDNPPILKDTKHLQYCNAVAVQNDAIKIHRNIIHAS